METEKAYSILTRAITDPKYLEALKDNPETVFRDEGLEDPDQIEELKKLAGRLVDREDYSSSTGMSAVWRDYYVRKLASSSEGIVAVQESLRGTIERIENSFTFTSIMYNVAFYLGVALVIFAAIFAVVRSDWVLSAIFGGLGVLDILVFFITKPPRQLENSRADLAKLQVAYYNWYVDNYDWHWYIGDLWKSGGPAFIRDRMKEASQILLSNTNATMELIEKYCSFKG